MINKEETKKRKKEAMQLAKRYTSPRRGLVFMTLSDLKESAKVPGLCLYTSNKAIVRAVSAWGYRSVLKEGKRGWLLRTTADGTVIPAGDFTWNERRWGGYWKPDVLKSL